MKVNQRRAGPRGMAYGLRWWLSKGAEPQLKWIVPSMVDVVRKAISNIRQQTCEARRIARWYEQNPNNMYLPAHLEHLRRRDVLLMQEIGGILFTGPSGKSSAE